jgi:hypothetical protein
MTQFLSLVGICEISLVLVLLHSFSRPHHKLLHKLTSYGIDGKINQWIKAFLTQRHQRIVVEGEFWSACTLDSGVPQGTVLGTLLFLYYINDLPKCVTSSVRLFADDCLLYRHVNSQNDSDLLQKDLSSLEKWAEGW